MGKQPTWFSRWRKYPVSILLHIFGWGVPAGILLGTAGLEPAGIIMLVGFALYELASGARHYANDGHMDTAGLDTVDAVVGAVPAYCITHLLEVHQGWTLNALLSLP